MKDKTGIELMASNYDGVGKSSGVLRNIASESRQYGRLDKDVYESIIKFQDKLKVDNNKNKGFVQFIAVKPIAIYYWTYNGVRRWHDLCKCNSVFMDATGSVLKQSSDTRILYYKLSVKAPGKGSHVFPVTAMLSSEHTVSAVSSFIARFKQDEK